MAGEVEGAGTSTLWSRCRTRDSFHSCIFLSSKEEMTKWNLTVSCPWH